MAYHKGGNSRKARRGSKSRKARRGGARKTHRVRKHHKRGGSVLSSAASVAHKALLPYVMYKAQKHQQKRVGASKSRSTRRRR